MTLAHLGRNETSHITMCKAYEMQILVIHNISAPRAINMETLAKSPWKKGSPIVGVVKITHQPLQRTLMKSNTQLLGITSARRMISQTYNCPNHCMPEERHNARDNHGRRR